MNRTLAALAALTFTIFHGPALSASSSEVTLTIYFGGTGLSADWWQAEEELPSFWWTKGLSRFNEPHLLSALYHYQDVSDPDQIKYFINGVGAWPECPGDPLCLATRGQKQQQKPHADSFWAVEMCGDLFLKKYDACWNWTDTLEDGLSYLDTVLGSLAYGEKLVINLLGNSRGGMTTMWFLQELKKAYDTDLIDEKIKSINIIAIDPVPGVNLTDGNNYGDIGKMGGKPVFSLVYPLTNYVGIYARDERSTKFGPLVPHVDTTTTRELVFSVRGSHENIVGSRQENGHSVLAGFLSESVENEGLKYVNDVVAVTAIELMSSEAWGRVKFEDEFYEKFYSGGRTGDVDTNKGVFMDTVRSMNSAEENFGFDYELIRKRSFIPLGLLESYHSEAGFGMDCHWFDTLTGAEIAKLHNEPRCALFIAGGPEGNLDYLEWGLEGIVPLVDDGAEGERVWSIIQTMRVPDQDNDGVPDDDDNCPLVKNPEQDDVCQITTNAGGPYFENCTGPQGADVQVDGTGTKDPEGDTLAFHWLAILPVPPPAYLSAVHCTPCGDDYDASDSHPVCPGTCGEHDYPTFSLPVGTYSLYLYTDDEKDSNHGRDISTITVSDPGLPDITCPNDIQVVCTGPEGAVADFEAVAEDLCDDEVVASCYPLPGSMFPLGTNQTVCTAADDTGNTSECTFTVEVLDLEPPAMDGITDPIRLWPPNHKFRTFDITDFIHSVTDNCAVLTLDDLNIAEVTNSEGASAYGGGDATDNIVIAADGKSVDLRIERTGINNGRVYTVYVKATDMGGNSTTEAFEVHIAHDRRR